VTPVLYTNTDQIRAALGVTAREIADAQINDLNVRDQLIFSLKTVYPDHASLWANNNPSADEKLIKSALILYCQYEAAVIMTPQLQFLTAQKITDGDAEMQRFQKDNLDETIARIKEMRDRYAKALGVAVPGYQPPAAVVHFGTVQPAYDPVTNTGTNPSPGSV
jgi:hypothetical protein